MFKQKKGLLYCPHIYKSLIPKNLSNYFRDQDFYIKNLISSAEESVLIVAPFLTVDGIKILKNVLLKSIKQGSLLKIVTSNIASWKENNIEAFMELVSGNSGNSIKEKLRILIGSKQLSELLHSKIIVVDSKTGYLGSANITYSAFEKNFEIGVKLSSSQASVITDLFLYWESTGMLVDQTNNLLNNGE